MLGTFINASAILAGGVAGLITHHELSPSAQSKIKAGLGAFTVLVGMYAVGSSLHDSFLQILKQFGIAFLALIAGNLIGKLLGLQKGLNRLGQRARQTFSSPAPKERSVNGPALIACSIVFALAPLAFLGSIQDGLRGDVRPLALKSVMDAMAAWAFARTYGWSVLLSVGAVLLCQGGLTAGCQIAIPLLRDHALTDSITLTNGLLICSVALLIFDVKKVPFADYLPSLLIAPLLTWIWS